MVKPDFQTGGAGLTTNRTPFSIHSIPKTFVYDRSGMLAAEFVYMPTRRQFLEMLRRAGIEELP